MFPAGMTHEQLRKFGWGSDLSIGQIRVLATRLMDRCDEWSRRDDLAAVSHYASRVSAAFASLAAHYSVAGEYNAMIRAQNEAKAWNRFVRQLHTSRHADFKALNVRFAAGELSRPWLDESATITVEA